MAEKPKAKAPAHGEGGGDSSALMTVGVIIFGALVYIIGVKVPVWKAEKAQPVPQTQTMPDIQTPQNPVHSNVVTLKTNFGTIVIETYNDDAPKTVANFTKLVSSGFYNNLTFHRVINGFMIQGGDPSGNGTGGPGYQFADELYPNTPSYQTGYKKGVVAMANAGPNTNGSQFFIMLQDTPLPHSYTIFGHVISGQDVVDAIGKTPTGAGDKPVSPVIIETATVSS